MQIYAIKYNYFMRLGDKNNSIVFDLFDDEIDLINKNKLTIDQVYDNFKENPIERIEKIKKRGIDGLISICGMRNNNFDSSNGTGKSTVLEGVSYALYDRIVRENVNTNKASDAGLAVVTRINKKYIKGMKESYVEVIFESNNKIYILKRGRTFTKTHNNSSPIHEFRCLNDNDSQSSHRKIDTQDAIKEVIGMEYDVFCNSVLFGQNDAGKFVSGTDKIKKEMIVLLLRLEHVVDGCLESIRVKKNEKDREISNIKSQIIILNENTSGKQSQEEIQRQIDRLKIKLTEIILTTNGIDSKLEFLAKSEKLIEIDRVKQEGKRVREDLKNKKDGLTNQTKEWQDLIEKTENSIKEDDKKSLELDSKILQTNEQIKFKKESIAKFNLKECEDKLKEIENQKLFKKEKELNIQKLREHHTQLISDISSLETLYNQNITIISELNSKLNKIGNDGKFECSECKSLVSREHIENKIKEYESKKDLKIIILKKSERDKIKEKINSLQKEIETIGVNIISSSEISSKIKQFEMDKNRLVEIQSNLQEQTKNKQDILININKNQEQKKNLLLKKQEVENKHNKDIEKLECQIKSLIEQYKNAENNAKSVKEEISKLTEDKNRLIKEKSACDSSIGSLNKEIEMIKEISTKMSALKKQQDLLEKELKRLIMLEDIYGLDGIQTRIVSRYLPLLNVYIKEFIDVLTNGNMGIEVFINEKSKVDILLNGGTADNFAMLSGGEKVLVKLAVSIGLGLLSFTRCANKPEIIMLDEVLGSLDNEHTGAVFKMLNVLKNKFSRVLIISHKPQINEIIERKIIIEKATGDLGMSEIKRAN